MPVKHIDEETWRKIEKKTVAEIVRTNKSIKEGEMLKRLIICGLKHYDEEQFQGEKKERMILTFTVCKVRNLA